jgi:small-conductance mechanosensitive channel
MHHLRVFSREKRKTVSNDDIGSRRLMCILVAVLILGLIATPYTYTEPVVAQGPSTSTPTPADNDTPLEAPNRVEIRPSARDEEIRERLNSILEATGWFVNPAVEVQEGVVFLTGQTQTQEFKRWAGDLARNTQDVAAVVNQIKIIEPSIWDFQPALSGFLELVRNVVRSIPMIGFSFLILLITWVIARFSISASRSSLNHRLASPLLSNVIAYTIGVVVFLIGLYIVLQLAGLTSVAMTVVGGTGLLGIVLGIAFRDITENFLASIFLSIQRPFHTGDLIEIDGVMGFVQALTPRVTVVMTPEGNHVQIPNTTVYKNNIYNFTSNPNSRADFTIGIGFKDSITHAQAVALKVLQDHPAVLKDPEPLVLVDNLGSATIRLRVYFWVDGAQHSLIKVKSSVIRLTLNAFQGEGISMPDELRERVFPEGVTVRNIEPNKKQRSGSFTPEPDKPKTADQPAPITNDGEAGLRSEAEDIQEQARHSRKPEEGENLLETPNKPSDR